MVLWEQSSFAYYFPHKLKSVPVLSLPLSQSNILMQSVPSMNIWIKRPAATTRNGLKTSATA